MYDLNIYDDRQILNRYRFSQKRRTNFLPILNQIYKTDTCLIIPVSNILKIQRYIRKWLDIRNYKKHGPAYYDRTICHNDSDFYTLESINNIETQNFVSYRDNFGFVYGFDINSLINLFKTDNNNNNNNNLCLINPYNRQQMPKYVIFMVMNLKREQKIRQMLKKCKTVKNK